MIYSKYRLTCKAMKREVKDLPHSPKDLQRCENQLLLSSITWESRLGEESLAQGWIYKDKLKKVEMAQVNPRTV